MFSVEVAKIKVNIYQIGLKKYKDRRRANSYKEQALQELSMRLYLEEIIEEMQKKMNKLIEENEMLKDKISG